MRFYITLRLDEEETGIIYDGFEWAHFCFSKLTDEPRKILFGSENGIIHPGIPFMPMWMMDEDFRFDVWQDSEPFRRLARYERSKYFNHFDGERGGVYPIGVLHTAHLYLRLVHIKMREIMKNNEEIEPWYVKPGASDFLTKLTRVDERKIKMAISLLENASQAWSIFKDIGNE